MTGEGTRCRRTSCSRDAAWLPAGVVIRGRAEDVIENTCASERAQAKEDEGLTLTKGRGRDARS